MEEKVLREYAGVYQWEPNAFVYLQMWNELSGTNQLVAFDESGEIRTLYPTDHRIEEASTLVASQLPAKEWHAVIGDPNLADSICDRLLHNAHRLDLKGPSIRRTKAAPKATAETKA